MSDLTGRTVLVMGGDRGVGRAVVRVLAAQHAHVLIHGSDHGPDADAALAEVIGAGSSGASYCCSPTDRAGVAQMLAAIHREHGHLDILVTNTDGFANRSAKVPASRAADSGPDWSAIAQALRWWAELSVPLFTKGGGGTVINLTALDAELAGAAPGGTPSDVCARLTRQLAGDYARLNIRVNTLQGNLIDGSAAGLLAGLVLFLASDAASSITGQQISVGGEVAFDKTVDPSQVRPPEKAEPLRQRPLGAADEEAFDKTVDPSQVRPPEKAEPLRQRPFGADGAAEPASGMDIAVVGMGLKVPGAADPESLFRLLMADQPVFSEPGARWDIENFYAEDGSGVEDSTYARKSGYIRDANEPGIPAEDYTTTWLRHSLIQALQGVHRVDRDRHLFAVGYTADGSQHLEESLVWESVKARLAPHLDLTDPAVTAALAQLRQALPHATDNAAASLPFAVGSAAAQGILPDNAELVMVDTACSSSLYSLSIGMRALRNGTCDIAACGASFAVGPRNSTLFASLHGLSASEDIRSFDNDADGVLFSDGAAVVILKTLARARADGDQILGVLAGVGTSSDGRGRAICAPNPKGQQIAVARAFDSADVTSADIDWVVAHATGTRAGDQAEIQTLKESLKNNSACFVTSNKSLLGHTGWVAGIVSLVHVLVALAHETIPGQRRFSAAPPEWKLGESSLRIPIADTAWRRGESPRTAAISGFGFGGTNAHVIVREDADDGRRRPTPPALVDDPVVLVGWSAELPGRPAPSGVRSWLAGTSPSPALSFGQIPELPRPGEFRIPSSTLNTVDRCQIMALQCVRSLEDELGNFWSRYRDTTGVIAGHMGPTRNGVGYALRTYLRHLSVTIAKQPALAPLRQAFDGYADQVRALVPASNEDSSPGIMPNIIPARIANYFDFHGANMTVDTGFASAISSTLVAVDRLRDHELDIALVIAINGNNTPEMRAVLGDDLEQNTELAEGAFLFALTRRSVADREGLAVLADLRKVHAERAGAGGGPAANSIPGRNYLAADAAIEIVRSVVTERPMTVTCRDPRTGRVAALSVTPQPLPAGSSSAPECLPAPKREPGTPVSSSAAAPEVPQTITPHSVALRLCAAETVRSAVPAIPEDCLIVTNDPELLHGVDLPSSTRIVSCVPTDLAGVIAASEHPDPDALSRAISAAGWRPRHLRVLAMLGPSREPGKPLFDEIVTLSDAVFLAAKVIEPELASGGSVAALLLDAVVSTDVEPFIPRSSTGLFTGMIKSLAQEFPQSLVYALLSSTTHLEVGLTQLAAESRKPRHIPVAVYHDERRAIPVPVPAKRETPGSRSGRHKLSRDSVVVAVGGSRGITAALLEAVAIRSAPTIWILGSNELNQARPTDSDALPTRADYLRTALSRQPTTPIAELNRAFDRLSNSRAASGTIERLTRLCGSGRVHYRACDITRGAEVEATVGEILAASGQIDLLVFGAGISRTALLSKKRPADFRAVRDVKVRGYANVRAALAGNPPRSWCNLGSVLGFTGQLGEVDYTAGNDFLNSCAQYSMLVDDVDEYTIGWTLWDTIGLAANPVSRSFFHRSGLSAGMSTAEGVQLFLAELDKDEHDPVTIHLGPAEFDMLEGRYPGIRGAMSDAARQPRRRRSPVAVGRRIAARDRALPDGRTLVHERTLDQENAGYLSEHLVNGRPTLPGTFGLQIGAEAARELVADRVPVAFESIIFDRFVRLHPVHGTATIRVSAELLSHTEVESRVHVRVSSDVLAPTGELLIADRLHFGLDVILADHPVAAPLWTQEATGLRIDVPDPYVLENPAVHLHGVMDTLRRTSSDGRTAEGIFAPAPGVHQEPLNRFQVPALLLDGLARTSVLTMQSGPDLPLLALASIGRVELFGTANDSALARSFGEIRLVSGPTTRGQDAIAFDGAAVAPDGRLVARMTSLIGTPIGQMNPQTRQFSPARIGDRPAAPSNSSGQAPAVGRLLAAHGAR